MLQMKKKEIWFRNSERRKRYFGLITTRESIMCFYLDKYFVGKLSSVNNNQ